MASDEVFCMIDAIPRSERPRYELLKSEIIKILNQGQIIEDESGLTFIFSGNPVVSQKLGEWISFEQACCPFFEFNVKVQPHSIGYKLSISGPTGAKEFLQTLICSQLTCSADCK